MNTNTRSRRRNRILEVLDSISYQLAHQVLLLLEEIEIVIAVLVVGYLISYILFNYYTYVYIIHLLETRNCKDSKQ